MVNYIVSGCPRSGTSMLMRVLKAAGMDIAEDEKRKADKHNPHGYFEVDDIINKLKENPEIISDFDGKVLKVTHFGIQFLPEGNYKLIYIERDFDEVFKSMEKMQGKTDEVTQENNPFIKFNQDVKKLLKERIDIDSLIVNYNKLLSNPEPEIEKIIHFLNISPEKKPDMLNAIDKKLYRNRNEDKEPKPSNPDDKKGMRIKDSEYIVQKLKSLGYM